jgi:hypothetical protein
MLDKKRLTVNNNLMIINVRLVVFGRYFEEQIIGVFRVVGAIILVIGGLESNVGTYMFDSGELNGEGGVEEVAVDEEVEDFEVVLVEEGQVLGGVGVEQSIVDNHFSVLGHFVEQVVHKMVGSVQLECTVPVPLLDKLLRGNIPHRYILGCTVFLDPVLVEFQFNDLLVKLNCILQLKLLRILLNQLRQKTNKLRQVVVVLIQQQFVVRLYQVV